MFALSDLYGVALDRWSVDDVVMFFAQVYSREILLQTVVENRPSEFLRALYSLWRPPSVSAWVRLLRRVCCLNSFRLFVNVLRLNHCQGENLANLAHALFIELPTCRTIFPPDFPKFDKTNVRSLPRDGRPFGEDLLETVVAAFVRRPHDISCSRQHACDLLALLGRLGPREVGVGCRRLLMYLARPADCHCDELESPRATHATRDPECRCPRRLALDPRKEYACALFREIMETARWGPEDREDLFVEACKHRFSEVVYREMAVCLSIVEPGLPPPPNPDVRSYSTQELKDCYNSSNYLVLPAGCVEVGFD